MKKLCTIDANTLQSVDYEPISFLVEDLLPPGLHLLAGAPKIGKSWMALWLCLQVEMCIRDRCYSDTLQMLHSSALYIPMPLNKGQLY